MRNAGLDASQAGIKIAGRNINILRYAVDTTLMAESEEDGLKLSIQKTKIMASGPITSWQMKEKKWKQWQILFSWASESLQMVTVAMKLKDARPLEGKLWQT